MNGERRLTITVTPADVMPAARSHEAVVGPFVTISIADTGRGIPPDRIEKIFEPFFTTKEVGQGPGLSLSQVFGFAKQSDGEVVVTSEFGKGASFALYLPRVAQDARTLRDIDDLEPLADGRGTCVLEIEWLQVNINTLGRRVPTIGCREGPQYFLSSSLT